MIGTTIPALKEWASAIKALETGRQVMVMRKGGIVEETRRFELKSPAFYLYPTYEHQRKELIKSSDHFYVDESLAEWVPEASTIRLTAYAEVTQDLEIRDQEMLDRLLDFHMWTADFAEDRLKVETKRSAPRIDTPSVPFEGTDGDSRITRIQRMPFMDFHSEWSGAERNDAGVGCCGF